MEVGWKPQREGRSNYTAPASVCGLEYKGLSVLLGWIKKRNDNRWDWHVCTSHLRDDWKPLLRQQGVLNTEEEAKAKVESGWNNH